jgi:hypothetical protein
MSGSDLSPSYMTVPEELFRLLVSIQEKMERLTGAPPLAFTTTPTPSPLPHRKSAPSPFAYPVGMPSMTP